jgi:hypothetical protein
MMFAFDQLCIWGYLVPHYVWHAYRFYLPIV